MIFHIHSLTTLSTAQFAFTRRRERPLLCSPEPSPSTAMFLRTLAPILPTRALFVDVLLSMVLVTDTDVSDADAVDAIAGRLFARADVLPAIHGITLIFTDATTVANVHVNVPHLFSVPSPRKPIEQSWRRRQRLTLMTYSSDDIRRHFRR